MEQEREVGDNHQPFPLIRRLRTADNQGRPPPPRICPRCMSNDTKFCYFNNYSVEQSRYYCRACKRYWTHGGIQRNIPIGGKSHKVKRSMNKHENQRIQLALPSPPQFPPFYPPTNVAPVAFIPPMAPPMMTPYGASGGFLSPLVEEATTHPQKLKVENGFLSLVNPLKSLEPLHNLSQSFLQPSTRHFGSMTQKFLLNNSDGASSSNSILLNTSVASTTTSGSTNVGWGSLILNPNEWLDYTGGFGPST